MIIVLALLWLLAWTASDLILFVLRSGVGCLSFSFPCTDSALHLWPPAASLSKAGRGLPFVSAGISAGISVKWIHISATRNHCSSTLPQLYFFTVLSEGHPPAILHIPVVSCPHPSLLSPPLLFSPVLSSPPYTILFNQQTTPLSCLPLLCFSNSFCNTSAHLCIRYVLPRPQLFLWTPFTEEEAEEKGKEKGEKHGWIKQMRGGWFTQLAPSCRLS